MQNHPPSDSLSNSLLLSHQDFYPKTALVLAASYLLFLAFFHALHPIHFIFVGVMLTLYFIHPRVRLFFLFGLPYVFYTVIFDAARFLPLFWPEVWTGSHVHVADIYEFDRLVFGVWVAGQKITFLDFIHRYAHPFLDIWVGMGYLMHSLGLLVLVILFFLKKYYRELQSLTLAFLVMNLMAMLTFIFFPVAPPWYVDQFGFALPSTPVVGNAAGLLAVDQHWNTHFMHHLFTYTPIVFGALPSMHAGFVMLTAIYAVRRYPRSWPLFLFYLIFICFGAVYTRHHYVIDLVAGVVYAFAAFWLTDRFLLPFLLSRKLKVSHRSVAISPAFGSPLSVRSERESL